jgi:succinate-semialdehyde dehydrogenase/glutarate-semialdehyde dehydrogenase
LYDSDFGLGGSVFKDIERGKRIADQIDSGMVFINHPTWTQADLPFGGTKGSVMVENFLKLELMNL